MGSYTFNGTTFEVRFIMTIPVTGFRNKVTNNTFPVLIPQTAILGIFNDSVSNIHLINHILLLFKLYIYKYRNKHRLKNINKLLVNILNIKKLEKVTAFGNAKNVAACNKK